ncbi:MAG: flagellar motor protein MotB [bacterium]
MSDNELQPIIIKKIKGGHGGHHGGAWKVAFADFMTAMMAFFMVMWLVGQKQEVREAVSGYFRDPGKFQKDGGAGVMRGGSSAIRMQDPLVLSPRNTESGGGGPTTQEKEALSGAAQQIMSELRKQSIFQKLKNNVSFQMTAEGLRIILNESENAPAFFETGSAKPLARSAGILMTIAKELGHLPNRLIVEGHTDAAYGGGQDYSNWELSSDRANAARQLMEVSGLATDQVREVRGFADKYPMIKDNPADARNRRVTIVVLYRSLEARYDDLTVGGDMIEEMENNSP